MLAVITSLLGYVLVRFGQETSGVLTSDCGSGGTTHAIERAREDLAVFRKACHRTEDGHGKAADECPGFELAFPPPAPYVLYLKVLELEERCAGFCHSSQPLFLPGSDLPRQQRRGGCAVHIGRRIFLVSSLVGVPAVLFGACLAVLGLTLCFFKEL